MAKVVYDPDLKSLTVTLPDSTLKLEHAGGFDFVATPGVAEEQKAVFLSESERTTLGKMIAYSLKTAPKMTEQGKADLEAVAEKLAAMGGTPLPAE